MAKKRKRSKKKKSQIEVVRDPVDQLVEQIMALRKEEDALITRLMKMKAKEDPEAEEIAEETREQLARERHKMTGEDVDKAVAAAKYDFGQRVGKAQWELDQLQKELMEGPRLSFVPDRDDSFPLGGVTWNFARGQEYKYPRVVIEAAQNRWRRMDQRENLKRQLGAVQRPGDLQPLEFGQMQAILDANK